MIYKYIYETNHLIRSITNGETLNEMSDKVLDKIEPDDGLEVEKKLRIKGKLPTDEEYALVAMGKSEDGHGEPKYLKCDHCGKTIVYIAKLGSPYGDHTVGTDCAIALTSGEARTKEPGPESVKTYKKVVDFVKKNRNKMNAIRNALKFYTKEAKGISGDEDFETVKLINNLSKGFGKVSQYNLAQIPFMTWRISYSNTDLSKAKKAIIRRIISNLLKDHVFEFKKAIEEAIEDGYSFRSKNYYWPKNMSQGLDFLNDYELWKLIKAPTMKIPQNKIENFPEF